MNFCKSADFGGNQEKIGKRLAQRLGNDHFGGRDAGTNGSQPRSERGPYQFGSNDREILEQTLGDHSGLDEYMVGADLALDLTSVSVRLAMKVLIAVPVAQRHHTPHPKMVGK
jgi:hypothetical protein